MATKKKNPGKASSEKLLAEEEEAGAFVGSGGFVDKTPNENYSVAGVSAGKPTPETDPEGRRPLTEAQPGAMAAAAEAEAGESEQAEADDADNADDDADKE